MDPPLWSGSQHLNSPALVAPPVRAPDGEVRVWGPASLDAVLEHCALARGGLRIPCRGRPGRAD
eukprot:10259688-Alexandrium_andersonii.AAC.1